VNIWHEYSISVELFKKKLKETKRRISGKTRKKEKEETRNTSSE
jgi:hypothetical protein